MDLSVKKKRAQERLQKANIARRQLAMERSDRDDEFRMNFTNFVGSWAACESWFIDVLALLLHTDGLCAAAVLYSFNSNRARVELVQRIGIMCLARADDVRALSKICKGFKKVTAMRNMLCHSRHDHYGPKEGGNSISSFHQMIFTKGNFDGTNYFEETELDDQFLKELHDAIVNTVRLNRRLQRFKDRIRGHVLRRPRELPLRLDEDRKTTKPRPRPGKRLGQKRPQRSSRA